MPLCSICLFSEKHIIAATGCGHIFHLTCLLKVIRNNNGKNNSNNTRLNPKCPACRSVISCTSIIELKFDPSIALQKSIDKITGLQISAESLSESNIQKQLHIVQLQKKREFASVSSYTQIYFYCVL